MEAWVSELAKIQFKILLKNTLFEIWNGLQNRAEIVQLEDEESEELKKKLESQFIIEAVFEFATPDQIKFQNLHSNTD